MIELLLDSHGTEASWDGWHCTQFVFHAKKALGLQSSRGSLPAILTYPFSGNYSLCQIK